MLLILQLARGRNRRYIRRSGRLLNPILNPASWIEAIVCNRAEVLWNLNDRSRALGECEAALAADPRFVRALVIMANILVELQRVSEACEALRSAEEIDPHDSDVLFGLSIG